MTGTSQNAKARRGAAGTRMACIIGRTWPCIIWSSICVRLPDPNSRMPGMVWRMTRGATVLVLSAGYLAYVFRLGDEPVRGGGLGDWIDPYFINGLLEHWFHVARTLANPASPPMFHPATHVLGY